MTTIALVCPSNAGHHQAFLRLFARTLAEMGHTVVAFTPQADDLAAWAAQTSPVLAARLLARELTYTRKYRVPGPLTVFFDKLAWVWFIGRMIRASGIQPDLVFHMWLDNCLTPGLTFRLTDLVFPYRWSGVYFHPWYLRQPMRYARLRLGPLSNHDALRSHNCPAVAVLDEGIAPKLQALLSDKPVIVFPDVADDAPPDFSFEPVVQLRERAQGRRVIGLLGVLARRKGLLTLMETARLAKDDRWYFVFAGEYLEDSFLPDERCRIAEFVQSAPPNCLFHFQRIPDEAQFNALVAECDVVFAVYAHFLSSSNLLAKAALFRKPVLVSDRYCMGERVRAYGIGLAIPEDDPAQCLAALRQLDQEGGPPAAAYETYLKAHSVAQLRQSFKALLAAAGL